MLGPEQARLLERIARGSRGNGANIDDIRSSTTLSGERVFFHLTVMAQVGLISTVIDGSDGSGPKVHYRLTDAGESAIADLWNGGGGGIRS
ncbi:MAG: hypothetical protein L0Z54_05785 [Thermoplasmata archaeon]|nr:hypothetical protein [Thermoplasmata archaeon]